MSEDEKQALTIYVMASRDLGDAYEDIVEASSRVLVTLQEMLEAPPAESTDVELNRLLLDIVKGRLKARKEAEHA